MAFTPIISGFITTAQLRAEIGRPTKDTADPGYISDAELEAIISRHHDNAIEHARRLAGERVENGLPPAPKELFQPVSINLVVSPNSPPLLEGDINPLYYPFVLQASDNEGRQYIFDDNITRTVNTAFTHKYVYKTVGRKVYVSPAPSPGEQPNPTKIFVHLVLETVVWNYLFEGDLVRQYNQAIINEAMTFLRNVVTEGTRLEQIFLPNDGVIGDLS